jgi:hypothetical protein
VTACWGANPKKAKLTSCVLLRWSRLELFFAHRLNSISIVGNFNSLHTNTPAKTGRFMLEGIEGRLGDGVLGR